MTDTDATEQTECTIMYCLGDAEFAYWMPDLGHFSEVRSPEHDFLEDGDLAPHVCESCRDRMASSSHWDGNRFVRPREKFVADGGTSRTERLGWVCDGCGKHVTGSIPRNQCADCGGRWFEATPKRLACGRCGDEDASRVFNSDHNRLCQKCIDYERKVVLE
jgi:hypothetical protein